MKIKLPKRTRVRGAIFRVIFFLPTAFSMQWGLFKMFPPAGCTWSPGGYGETCAGVPYLISFVYCLALSVLAGIWCTRVDDWWADRTKDDEPSNPDPAADLRKNWKRSLDD